MSFIQSHKPSCHLGRQHDSAKYSILDSVSAAVPSIDKLTIDKALTTVKPANSRVISVAYSNRWCSDGWLPIGLCHLQYVAVTTVAGPSSPQRWLTQSSSVTTIFTAVYGFRSASRMTMTMEVDGQPSQHRHLLKYPNDAWASRDSV